MTARGMRRLAAGVAVAAAAFALGAGAWWLLAPGSGTPGGARATLLDLQGTLGGADTVGYRRADAPRTFVFPEDHGPHDGFRTEWWYFVGNVTTGEDGGGRRFGYQLTFFRSALAPDGRPGPERTDSRWATRHAWMAHFTVTDVEAGRFHPHERFRREALELAGARALPLRVRVGRWEVESESGDPGRDAFPLRLRAAGDSASVDLRLSAGKGVVLQGDGGLSRKGPEPGNASYYYSMPRLDTEGWITTPEGRFFVRGTSWLDREWSTSALPEGVVGWDWFALQLGDGRELMVYGLRRADGSLTPLSRGTLVGPDGAATSLERRDFDIQVLDRWESPLDGAVYPSGWSIRVPGHGLDLEVRPVLRDQELDGAFRYWEGAVDVRPGGDATSPGGRGYVELTGYAGAGGAPG